jgi:hypothetical protein
LPSRVLAPSLYRNFPEYGPGVRRDDNDYDIATFTEDSVSSTLKQR